MATTENGDAIDRAYAAMISGDLEAARAQFTADAVIWHGFDQLPRTLDETMADWQGLLGAFSERGAEDVKRRSAGDGTFVQQHLFVVRDKAGVRKAWPVCLVVRIEDGRIKRLDEYIDRAGSFPVGEGPLTTPGM